MRHELLTIREAAAYARLAPSTIRHAITQGQLVVVRPGGRRRVLIPEAELRAFIFGDGPERAPSGSKALVADAPRRQTRRHRHLYRVPGHAVNSPETN